MKIKLGLLGRDISHSRSKQMYEKIYNSEIDYKLFDYKSSELIPALDIIFEDVDGLSITAPYKKHFIKECIIEKDIVDLDAINCIKKLDQEFYATNTDFLAVKNIIVKYYYQNKNVIILGSGSMARIVEKAFNDFHTPVLKISRSTNGDITKIDLSKYFEENVLVVNACARAYEFNGQICSGTLFWDLNYSHVHNETFLSNKCEYIDGLELLYLQAVEATRFWNF